VRYALDALRRRPGRSAMTSLGIGLAVGLVVLLLALSAGIQDSVSTLAAESGVDILAVSVTNLTEFPPALSQIQDAHSLPTAMQAADSNVATASPWLVSDLIFGNQSLWAQANHSSVPSNWAPANSETVGWIPSDNSGIQIPELYNGTGFSYPGDPYYSNGYNGTRTHEIVLDQALAATLHVEVGETVWLGESEPAPASNPASSLEAWYANATGFTVVGISGPFWLIPTESLAFVYLSELQSVLGYASSATDFATVVLIHLNDPTSVTIDRDRLAAKFPELTLFTTQQLLGAIQHVINLYRTFGDIIGVIGIVVAALFATTVLQMSVDDRSRELALLRAIGHSRSSVGWIVVQEALWLSLFGLAIGLPLSYLTGYGLNLFLKHLLIGLPASFSFVSFDPGVLLDGLLIVLGVGLVAAIAPSARAMQLPVAEELRAP